MALPEGVHSCVLNAGPYINAEGSPLSVALTVTPVFGTGVDFITHNASGVSMSNAAIAGTVQPDDSAQVTVPVVDQSGWIDPSAAAYTLWRYTVSWTVAGKTLTKNIQPLDGQTFIDLDKVASGPVATPVSTPIAVVTDIGGFTGSVSVEDLETLGISGGGGGAADWNTLQNFPAYVAAGSTQSAARTVIGAGVSNLALGSSGTTAKAGNWTPTIADLPAGDVLYTTGTTRPTSRTDVIVLFLGSDPGTAALDNDLWLQL